MCGIAGIVRFDGEPVFEQEVRAMCGMLVHRGPDEEGVYLGPGVALGMRRLSIIDLDSSQQPICNEDRSIWVVFNGEIYNYQELRTQLVRNGHTLQTTSDTETIVHLYESYPESFVERQWRLSVARIEKVRGFGKPAKGRRGPGAGWWSGRGGGT